jgi:hypothetical protein
MESIVIAAISVKTINPWMRGRVYTPVTEGNFAQ